MIIVTAVTTDDALAQLANKIIQSISDTITINEQHFNISTSLGISIYPSDGNDYSSLSKKRTRPYILQKKMAVVSFNSMGMRLVILSECRLSFCLWWSRRESNPRPSDCEPDALPTELRPPAQSAGDVVYIPIAFV